MIELNSNQIFMACHPSMHLALAHLQLLCFREALSRHCLQQANCSVAKKNKAFRSKNETPKKKSGFLGSKLHESVAPDSAVPDKRCRNNEVSEMSHRKHGSAVRDLKSFLIFKVVKMLLYILFTMFV